MITVALALTGCADEGPMEVERPEASFSASASTATATGLQVVSGDGQIGLISETLANPLVVRVVDAAGAPVSGRIVYWKATSGGGSMPGTSTSNAQGLAQVPWRMGSVAGPATAEAYITVGAQTVKAPFTATAVAAGQLRTWTGAVSTDWKDQRNWQPEGVPTSKDTAEIAAAGRLPVLGSSTTVYRLVVHKGTNLEVASAAALAVATDVAADGPVTGPGKVLINGKGGTLRGTLSHLDIVQGLAVPAVTLDGPLSVTGNLNVSSQLTVNGKRVEVQGNLSVPSSNGRLRMINAADSVIVRGSASFLAGGGSGNLTAGVLQVAGNFTQKGTGSFVATGAHTTELIGTVQQVIDFDYGRIVSNRFSNLRVSNPAGFRIVKDVAVGGTLRAGGSGPISGLDTLFVAQDVTLGSRVDLLALSVGDTLTANGTEYLVANTIFNGSGTRQQFIPSLPYRNLRVAGYATSAVAVAKVPLLIKGDLEVASGSLTTASGGSTVVGGKLVLANGSSMRLEGPMIVGGDATISGSTARLTVNGQELSIGGHLTAAAQQAVRMLNVKDRVTVAGNATFSSDHRNALKAGILTVRGNFTQTGNIWSFVADEAHQVVLDGSAPQTVSFADTAGYSYFHKLRIANKTGVTFATNARVRQTLDHAGQATVPSGATLKVVGYNVYRNGVYVYQKATLNLLAGSVLNNQGATRAEILNRSATATVNGNPVMP